MASLQFTVWASASAVAEGPVLNENVITIGGTSAASAGVVDPGGGNRARYVRVVADAICWVTWGGSPTALNDGTEGRMLGSENPEFFWIPADEKIAVIQRS